MMSTIALPGGDRLRIGTMHSAGAVSIQLLSPKSAIKSELFVPAGVVAVVAQAIERAGHVVKTGPCARAPLDPAAVQAVKDFVAGVPELPAQVCTSIAACQDRTTPCVNAAHCGQMWG
jgi:hypothetical protein